MFRALHLNRKPEFYHSVFANCTTGLSGVLNSDPRLKNPDWRAILNGYFEKYLFEQGFLEHRCGESFNSLKARSYVNGNKNNILEKK